MGARIAVKNGSVYLDRETVETYFKGVEAVIVLIRDGQLQILPVHQLAAGGCLLKIRNSDGDRVASSPDVFAKHELLAWHATDLEAVWSGAVGAMVADLPVN